MQKTFCYLKIKSFLFSFISSKADCFKEYLFSRVSDNGLGRFLQTGIRSVLILCQCGQRGREHWVGMYGNIRVFIWPCWVFNKSKEHI